eukprot:COSAG02_NODE_422_length_22587_cov_10.209089_18_plen_80_part_00
MEAGSSTHGSSTTPSLPLFSARYARPFALVAMATSGATISASSSIMADFMAYVATNTTNFGCLCSDRIFNVHFESNEST